MDHTRKTINGKLRAYNEGKCTLQQFVDEIEAFFGELDQIKQESDKLLIGKFRRTYFTGFHDGKITIVNVALGD